MKAGKMRDGMGKSGQAAGRAGLMGSMAKRLTAALCACALATGLTGCALTTPSRAEVEREKPTPVLSASDLITEGVLTVAMDTTGAPQAMPDADGLPSGYYADVARALAERLGLDLKVVSSADSTDALGSAEADLYVGAGVDDADEDVTVTGSVLENAAALFMHYDGDAADAPAPSINEISGSVIAVQRDSASQDALARAGIGAELKTCANVNECFEALAAGEADFVACDATAGAYLARAYPNVVFCATVDAASAFGVAMPSGTAALATEVSSALDAIEGDGTLEAVHRFWYGAVPMSLSGSLLPGVTLTSEDEDEDEGEQAEGSEAGSQDQDEDSEFAITGDLNSLD